MTSAADKIEGRQLEFLKRASEGEPHKSIADDFGISINTLKQYRKRLYSRLGARNAIQALRRYLELRNKQLVLFK